MHLRKPSKVKATEKGKTTEILKLIESGARPDPFFDIPLVQRVKVETAKQNLLKSETGKIKDPVTSKLARLRVRFNDPINHTRSHSTASSTASTSPTNLTPTKRTP